MLNILFMKVAKQTLDNREVELGKLVFMGTIAFLSISLGILNFLLSFVNVDNVVIFTVFILFSLASGGASLICLFHGLNANNKKYITVGFYLFLGMVAFVVLIYLTMFQSAISQALVNAPPE